MALARAATELMTCKRNNLGSGLDTKNCQHNLTIRSCGLATADSDGQIGRILWVRSSINWCCRLFQTTGATLRKAQLCNVDLGILWWDDSSCYSRLTSGSMACLLSWPWTSVLQLSTLFAQMFWCSGASRWQCSVVTLETFKSCSNV